MSAEEDVAAREQLCNGQEKTLLGSSLDSRLPTSTFGERFKFACRRLLLRLTHFLVGVAVFLAYCSHRITDVVIRLVWMIFTGGRRVLKLKKVPVHLALSVDAPSKGGQALTTDSCIASVASLIAWCVVAGIPYITLYDHGGLLKSQAEELRQRIAETCRPRSKCKVIVLDDDGDESTQNNNLQQLRERKDVVHVQLLRCQDGRQDLVDSARRLAQLTAKEPARTSQFVTADFVQQIQSNRGFPSPDILICYGNACSTIGFLPWHINLTEIFYLPTYRQMTFDTFHGILSRYEKCEQRLGK